MKINGIETNLPDNTTLFEYLIQAGYDPIRVAVEKNGQIVPKREFSNVTLQKTDALEIVSFVGGG